MVMRLIIYTPIGAASKTYLVVRKLSDDPIRPLRSDARSFYP